MKISEPESAYGDKKKSEEALNLHGIKDAFHNQIAL